MESKMEKDRKSTATRRKIPLDKEKFLALAKDIRKIVAKEQKTQHAK
jgi:hypothetical protein